MSTVQQGMGHSDVKVQRAGHSDVYSITRNGGQ